MPRFVILPGAILLTFTSKLSFADEPDVKACLPWTNLVGITIGMDRKAFEELRPNARFASIDGSRRMGPPGREFRVLRGQSPVAPLIMKAS